MSRGHPHPLVFYLCALARVESCRWHLFGWRQSIEYRFIPRFWLGEFGGAWATPSGYTQIEEIKINIQSPTLKSRALYILKILKGKEIVMKNFWLVGCDTV
jgi:hypothetical protein